MRVFIITMLVFAPGLLSAQVWLGDSIPVSLTGTIGDPVRGRSVVTGRTSGLCLLCHNGAFEEERFQGTLAPDLVMSIQHLSEGQIRGRIVDASRANRNSIMPSFYRIDHLSKVANPYVGKTLLSKEQVEDVVAFLVTLKKP